MRSGITGIMSHINSFVGLFLFAHRVILISPPEGAWRQNKVTAVQAAAAAASKLGKCVESFSL